ncbi:MAG: type IV pilus modification protein PilV [Piscinibacter sp.]|jgi:type IV pilus assembly protein PilV|nr:type IV pilus modification protein PilV [Piscinibacter sp.]
MTSEAPTRHLTPKQARRLQLGMTMIESLVAIVVLSFGMLGVVGLQAAALQSNKEARYQSSAVRLARELGELLRGNKNVAIEALSADNPYLVEFTGTLPSGTSDCFAGACATTLDVASFQIREWLARVDAELPGARVTVCIDDASFDAGGLPIWDCSGSGGTVVVKIGWVQATTDHAAVGSSGHGSSTPGLNRATRPGVVVALIAGSSE